MDTEKILNDSKSDPDTDENPCLPSENPDIPPQKSRLSPKEALFNILKGTAVGIADAIPGVSGGTLAVILKIYDQLLSAISIDPKRLKKNFGFLATVGVGILLGLVIASKVLSYLFEEHNVPTQMFFLGVIIGSIPGIYKECTRERKLRPSDTIPFLLAAAAMLLFTFLMPGGNSADSINPVAIILMTAAAAAAMIMPGISGALVLKTLGGYDLAIRSVSSLDIGTLVFYAIGAVIGLLGAAKIISVLIEKHRCPTYCAILGLIAGSTAAIFPRDFSFNAEGIVGIAMLIIGLAVPTLTELPGKLKKTTDQNY